ncbi:hypothetical protein GCM10009109_11600 [Marinobacterium sediminicola]
MAAVQLLQNLPVGVVNAGAVAWLFGRQAQGTQDAEQKRGIFQHATIIEPSFPARKPVFEAESPVLLGVQWRKC